MLADPLHLSRHQTTPSPPPLSSSCSSHRSAKLKTSNPCNHRNQQYSIIGLTNAAGTLVERYSYTAYGTLGIYDPSGTVRTTSTYANRYTYTGREYDPDLALYHFRARWYDPSTGGFISRDPLGYVDGTSLYRGYFQNSDTDPSGTRSIQDPRQDRDEKGVTEEWAKKNIGSWDVKYDSGKQTLTDGVAGFSIKIKQGFKRRAGKNFNAGTQAWQTNVTTGWMIDTDCNATRIEKYILDVSDMQDRPVVFAGVELPAETVITDTNAVYPKDFDKTNPCFLTAYIEKHLGFRPYSEFGFVAAPIPIPNGKRSHAFGEGDPNFGPQHPHWVLAQKKSPPFWDGFFDYYYLDDRCCKCSAVFQHLVALKNPLIYSEMCNKCGDTKPFPSFKYEVLNTNIPGLTVGVPGSDKGK